MKNQFSNQLNQIQQLWSNGFRGTGPDGRIIKRDETLINNALNKSTTTDIKSSTTTKSQTKSTSTNNNLSKEEIIELKKQLNKQSKQHVPH